VGVFRAYFTRHGVGPFVTEEPSLAAVLPEPHNVTSPWQRTFRRGYFDLVAARYALEITGGADQLAVTHLDQLVNMPTWKLCSAYYFDGPANHLDLFFDHHQRVINRIKVHRPPTLEHQGQLGQQLFHCQPVYEFDSGGSGPFDPETCLSLLEQQLGLPVSIISCGSTADDKQFRQHGHQLR
jgi:adenylosuccinate synthase